MTLDHETAVRNSLVDVVGDLLDSGNCVFTLADGTTEVATIALGAAAFPAGSSGASTWANNPASDSDATGNASAVTKFKMEESDTTRVFGGSVTATSGGGDIELTSTTIGAGDTVTLSSFSYTASA